MEDTSQLLLFIFKKNCLKFTGVIFSVICVKTSHNVEYSYWLTKFTLAGEIGARWYDLTIIAINFFPKVNYYIF